MTGAGMTNISQITHKLPEDITKVSSVEENYDILKTARENKQITIKRSQFVWLQVSQQKTCSGENGMRLP